MKSETKYIFSKGDLTRQDFSIKYKNEKGNFYLPIEKVKEIYCFNELTLSTKLLEILSTAGIIIHENKILTHRDVNKDHYCLPGGRVEMGETAEHAVIREVQEELNITPKIIRPLWLNQAFFIEDVDKMNYHELCIYFLMDISETDLLSKGNKFTLQERQHTHHFEWLDFSRLEREYFYSIFLKKDIFHLPEQFTIRTECE